MNDYSNFLFATPSFMEGAARILDLGGTLSEFNSSPTAEQADLNALRADWRAVGMDIEQAMTKVRGEQ